MAGAVEEFGEQQDWPAEIVFKVNLVLEELVVNAMTHGSHEGLADIEVTVTSTEDLVSIRLSDNGVAFDPLTDAPDPELAGSVEDRDVGGLGIHLVRSMMDDVSYRRENGRNLLTMSTRRS